MTHEAELRGYVDVWWQAVDDFSTLLEELPEDEWSTPTDLAGWDVQAVAAHVAHLEALLDGARHEEVELGELEHVRSPMGTFTEQGVVVRRQHTADELINEIRGAATRRRTALLESPPTDGDATAPGLFGALGWSTRTLLRNRPLDIWMHEQDVRRAVGRPGNLDSAGALHTASYLMESLGMVLAKRVGAEPGTTVVLDVEGHPPLAVRVTEQRRGETLDSVPDDADATIRTDRESFIVLAGGRRSPEPGRVQVDGDADLGRRVIEAMAVTP